MKHIVQFSGGKDSTAMLLRMIDEGMPIDEVIFCDTGVEFPQMYEHIAKVEKYTNMKITILKGEHSYEYYFAEAVRVKGKYIGKKGYGWSSFRIRWCNKFLKVAPYNKYIKRKYGDEQIKMYLGIAYDEPKRIKEHNYPLVDWKMTEADCLKYCYDRGFDWDGLYKIFNRVSCYLCPLQRVGELRKLRENFPELWQNMLDLDKKLPMPILSFKYPRGLQYYADRFAKEDIDKEQELFKEKETDNEK